MSLLKRINGTVFVPIVHPDTRSVHPRDLAGIMARRAIQVYRRDNPLEEPPPDRNYELNVGPGECWRIDRIGEETGIPLATLRHWAYIGRVNGHKEPVETDNGKRDVWMLDVHSVIKWATRED